MTLIDTHTHLFSEEFKDDINTVIERAIEAGVQKMYLPNVDIETIEAMEILAKNYPENCFAMMGLHPCSVKENFENDLKLIEAKLSANTYFGIGETGIDLFWDKTFEKEQKISLHKHCKWAKQYNLPIILHTREAFNETYEVIKTENNEKLKGIFHCFSGTMEEAEKVIELGNFYLGIGGVITFKNSKLPEVIEAIDLKHIVLETDSPYLAPMPFRGKRNESAYLIQVAQKIADIKRMSLSDLTKITTENAQKLFNND